MLRLTSQDQTQVVMKNAHHITLTTPTYWCKQRTLYVFTLPPPFAT